MAKSNGEDRQPLPPYVPFKTLLGFVKRFKETVVPEQVDSGVLRSYSGSTARQLMAALRFLGLIDENDATMSALTLLVNDYDTPKWPASFGGVLREAYGPMIGDLRLEVATKSQLADRFRKRGAEGEMLQKCIGFFVAAMQNAEAKLSPFILEKHRPTSDRSRTRPRRNRQNNANDDDKASDSPTGLPGETFRFMIPLPDKMPVILTLPKGLTMDDWQIIDAMMRVYLSGGRKA